METGLSARQTARYISRKHPRRLVAYVDGACVNNGRLGPHADWAVVCGPPGNDPCVASGRLEDKGPFGEDIIVTSNRAELRAAIAALRLYDWQDEGFERIVIATDSNYVAEGATTWAQGWVFRRWKTRTHNDVKNQDLWELLLGGVERRYDRGLRVDILQISMSYNAHADTAAKEAARNGVAIAEFQDITFGSSPLTKTGRYEALYTENGGYIVAAVEFARVEMGRLGCIGNMFGNEDTDAVTLALCGLL
ncbi:RNase H type-1 domain-containing protein [Fusarium falciforme]|uniref:RNase H type-1 domain-containing protein n=1 Tax=Fusarium falciforme TaxID=195108 RepID=UPI0023006F94|nr:RNase H type-1 domain-containing protein [Fusarium falciforme]WAO92048.1 RNase H type-1 domain-containing protein [Fusarium falciforme]